MNFNRESKTNVIPFVTTYYPNADNNTSIKIVKQNFKYLENAELKTIFRDTNFILLLRQPKNLFREWISSTFRIKTNETKPDTYKCSGIPKYTKYTKYIKMQLIVLKCQTAKFGKSADISIVTI